MKKALLRFCLAVVFLVPSIFLPAACGNGQENYYYTIETPQNCTFFVFSSASDAHGTFVNKGQLFEGQVEITPGYEVSGELVIKVNGEAAEWTEQGENGYYSFSFTPTEDFSIKIEGTIVESSYKVNFTEYEDTDLSDLYIRFEGETEQTLGEFLSSADATRTFKYNESLAFYLYTKGYSEEPSVSGSIARDFYKDEEKNEYGYFCHTEVTYDLTIEFLGKIPTNYSFVSDESGSNYTSSIDSEQLKLFAEGDTLTITFGNAITEDTISQLTLTLTINGERQTVSLKAGENTIKLKQAYEYVSSDGLDYSPYHYTIDLNFYDFDAFDGITF